MYLLNEKNQVQCPFCDEILYQLKSIETKCRERPNITIDGFKVVCSNCGSMHGHKTANEFVDFYENMTSQIYQNRTIGLPGAHTP